MTGPTIRWPPNNGHGIVQLAHGHLDEAEPALDRALRISRESEVRLFVPLILPRSETSMCKREKPRVRATFCCRQSTRPMSWGMQPARLRYRPISAPPMRNWAKSSTGLSLARACQAGARQKGYGGIEVLASFHEANILASQGTSGRADAVDCLKRMIDLATPIGRSIRAISLSPSATS